MPDLDVDALMEALRKAPREVIHAVVYPSGVGGSKSPGDELWHMSFELAAWARPDGPVQHSKLWVCRDVDDDELKSYQQRLPDYSVVALEVGLVEDFPDWRPEAWLYAVLPEPPARPELFEIADELGKPVTTEDPQFGTFTLDRRIGWYEAQTFWGAHSISLHLKPNREGDDNDDDDDDDDGIFGCLICAKALWEGQEEWDREVREYMVNELLDLKNGTWLEEDEAELSAEEFLQRVTLESISIDSEGEFEFWFGDGDLFWGHSIMVSGALDRGVDDAGIHG
jgi:hypothetical protein